VATARALVLHCAVRVLPDPLNVTALQPLIETPPSVKLTVPLGLKPVTDAVKATLAPATDGLAELEREVEAAALLTVCVSVALVEVLFDASPLYTALMPWLPVVRPEVAHEAVRMLPEPPTAAAEQPGTDVDPSLKLTVPVGDTPLTVAVKVTLLPTVEGVSDVAMPVVLLAPLTVCDSAALLEAAFPASPP
jgi:hypothetical protein